MPERDYTILAQREDRAIGPLGRVIDAVLVAYEGPAGIQGEVIVPVSEYTPARVDQLIRERLQNHLAVRQLGERN